MSPVLPPPQDPGDWMARRGASERDVLPFFHRRVAAGGGVVDIRRDCNNKRSGLEEGIGRRVRAPRFVYPGWGKCTSRFYALRTVFVAGEENGLAIVKERRETKQCSIVRDIKLT